VFGHFQLPQLIAQRRGELKILGLDRALEAPAKAQDARCTFTVGPAGGGDHLANVLGASMKAAQQASKMLVVVPIAYRTPESPRLSEVRSGHAAGWTASEVRHIRDLADLRQEVREWSIGLVRVQLHPT